MQTSKDDLQFHDSGGQDDVLFDKSDGQTHTFTNFPDSAVDIDDEESGDNAQVFLKSFTLFTHSYTIFYIGK